MGKPTETHGSNSQCIYFHGSSHLFVKINLLQFLISWWRAILTPNSSSLFSKYCMPARRILRNMERYCLFSSLTRILARFSLVPLEKCFCPGSQHKTPIFDERSGSVLSDHQFCFCGGYWATKTIHLTGVIMTRTFLKEERYEIKERLYYCTSSVSKKLLNVITMATLQGGESCTGSTSFWICCWLDMLLHKVKHWLLAVWISYPALCTPFVASDFHCSVNHLWF